MHFDLIIERYLQRFQPSMYSEKALYGRSLTFLTQVLWRLQILVPTHDVPRDLGPINDSYFF